MEKKDRDFLQTHIEGWEKEVEELRDRINRVRSILVDLRNPKDKFICEHVEERQGVCVGCPYAMPQWNKYDHTFRLIGGEKVEEYPGSERTCTQWEQKEWQAICGCYGREKCSCGYSQDRCFPPPKPCCPYCGGQTTFSIFERSPMLKFPFLTSSPLIKDAEL